MRLNKDLDDGHQLQGRLSLRGQLREANDQI